MKKLFLYLFIMLSLYSSEISDLKDRFINDDTNSDFNFIIYNFDTMNYSFDSREYELPKDCDKFLEVYEKESSKGWDLPTRYIEGILESKDFCDSNHLANKILNNHTKNIKFDYFNTKNEILNLSIANIPYWTNIGGDEIFNWQQNNLKKEYPSTFVMGPFSNSKDFKDKVIDYESCKFKDGELILNEIVEEDNVIKCLTDNVNSYFDNYEIISFIKGDYNGDEYMDILMIFNSPLGTHIYTRYEENGNYIDITNDK